jgi:pimeloyl-ACP methyl ester carboxylesterase
VSVVFARVMAAAQRPFREEILEQTVAAAAWRDAPAWYAVASEDRVVRPELQRFLALRIGARTVELRTSHVPFVSRPEEVVRVILEACGARRAR